MNAPHPEIIAKLESQQNIWFGCVKPNGRPHLSPVWFVWHAEKIYIGTDPKSVKARNIQDNPYVVLALEDGSHPVICEGKARALQAKPSEDLQAAFFQKYEWNLSQEQQYNLIVEVTPEKWLNW